MWKTLLVLPIFVTEIANAQTIHREDFRIASDPGVQIFVREIKTRKRSKRPPILLLHGGGGGGIASFDLPIAGGSLAEDLAKEGQHVFIMDARGWETSTRPDYDTLKRWMIAASSIEVSHDIDAVVDFIRERTKAKQVALFGWATGGQWMGYYACIYPNRVSSLMMLNSLYNEKAPWAYTIPFRSPLDTSQFDYASTPVLRRAGKQQLLDNWDKSIPVEDKSLWRDPAIAELYAKTAVGFYEDSILSVPGGYRAEAFYTAQGRGQWHAKEIRVPVLYIRGAHDNWSRPQDLLALQLRLENAPKKLFITLPDGSHNVQLDRPEKGRARLIQEIVAFNVKRK
ncbi:alpha/beta fold hydrolase [Chitinophaga sp. GCM10012297]|uniref:Alpha/beta fold hydrolase n=1 Tax=Chitinophaga chungangae TaxID=2821488 RepID=A0ABS3YIB0_9BACT|nr:alpha/beta fold hydrolase [Chitinophaga chungangae]MBO9154428.1 alpha/beta fold hydrolase [Chitinophaga chungangae]